jgi:hypothetical protein
VTEAAGGVRYRFPVRPLGGARWIGLAAILLGLAMGVLPLAAATVGILALVSSGTSTLAWAAIAVGTVTLGLMPVGLKLAIAGLFALAGHSEIDLQQDALLAIERCGPVRWEWQRSTADLRRFLVSESLGPLRRTGAREALAAILNFLLGWRGNLAVIIPQWKAAVGTSKVTPLWLAPSCPRAWLLAVADDLARRCMPSAEPAIFDDAIIAGEAAATRVPSFGISSTALNLPQLPPESASNEPPAHIAVVEQDADLSEYEELHEQPLGSKIVATPSTCGLTVIIPPRGWDAYRGWIAGGMIPCLVGMCMCLSAFSGETSTWTAAVLVALALPLAALGIGLFMLAYHSASGRVVLDVIGDTLVVWQPGLFGARPRRWSRAEPADVFVMEVQGGEDEPDFWELQIHSQPGYCRPLRLLAHRDETELRWLATLLRRTLECPATSPFSPPPGFIVRSPALLARWHKRRSKT